MNKCIYKLSPIVKDAIWGGKNIFEIEGNCSETVAELWEYVNLPQKSNWRGKIVSGIFLALFVA